MDIRSGRWGSSENVARQSRAVSSGHATVTEFSLRVTLIGPCCTRVRSSGTAAGGACIGNRTRAARQASLARSVFMDVDEWPVDRPELALILLHKIQESSHDGVFGAPRLQPGRRNLVAHLLE